MTFEGHKISKGVVLLFFVLSLSCVWLYEALWTFMSFTITWSLLKLTSIELVMTSNHFVLLYLSLPAFNIFQPLSLFQWVGCFRWPRCWSFSFSISPSSENSESPCSPREYQESFSTPQFKSISSSVLSLLYGPALTPINDYWKCHNLII